MIFRNFKNFNYSTSEHGYPRERWFIAIALKCFRIVRWTFAHCDPPKTATYSTGGSLIPYFFFFFIVPLDNPDESLRGGGRRSQTTTRGAPGEAQHVARGKTLRRFVRVQSESDRSAWPLLRHIFIYSSRFVNAKLRVWSDGCCEGAPDTRRLAGAGRGGGGGRAVTGTVAASRARLLLRGGGRGRGAVTGAGKGVFTKTPAARRRRCRRPVERIDFTVIHLVHRRRFPTPSRRRPAGTPGSGGVRGNDIRPVSYFIPPPLRETITRAVLGGGGKGLWREGADLLTLDFAAFLGHRKNVERRIAVERSDRTPTTHAGDAIIPEYFNPPPGNNIPGISLCSRC